MTCAHVLLRVALVFASYMMLKFIKYPAVGTLVPRVNVTANVVVEPVTVLAGTMDTAPNVPAPAVVA